MRQRWLARLALGAIAAALVLLVAGPSGRGIGLLLVIAAQALVTVLGLWLMLSHRGAVRAVGAVLVVVATIGALAVEAANNLVWVVVVCLALLVVAYVAGHAALRRPTTTEATAPASPAAPPRHAFLIMNPLSGGGKVTKHQLAERATALGAEVALLDPTTHTDVESLARQAVAAGADLLGVAGGDGTQALVASVAAEKDIPLLVIPAGTRNHFALDLGLDLEDPAASLQGLVDGVDVTVDLGTVGGRPFVNNASFGAYASVVARDDYRGDKLKVTMDVLPDAVTGRDGARLVVTADDLVIEDPTIALVSNNSYGGTDLAGLAHRPRLDDGVLGVVTARVSNAREATALLTGRRAPGLNVTTAHEVTITSDQPEVPVGIDGESVLLPAPVHCEIRPAALHVRLPRDRPRRVMTQPLTLRTLVAAAGIHHNGSPA